MYIYIYIYIYIYTRYKNSLYTTRFTLPLRATSLLKSHPEFEHVDDVDRLPNPSSFRICQYFPSSQGSYLRQVYQKWKDSRSLIASTFMLRHSSRTDLRAWTQIPIGKDIMTRLRDTFFYFIFFPRISFFDSEHFERCFNISDTGSR